MIHLWSRFASKKKYVGVLAWSKLASKEKYGVALAVKSQILMVQSFRVESSSVETGGSH